MARTRRSRSRSVRVPALAAAAALAAILAAAPTRPALAQDPGDRVQITLKSGEKYKGTLVSRTAEKVVLNMGGEEVGVPASLVASVDVLAARAPRPAPAPAPAAPREESPREGGGEEEGVAPPPVTLALRDGTTVRGYVIRKDDRRFWVVTGEPREVLRKDLAEAGGDAADASGDPFAATGATPERARKLVEELASEDRARVRAAAAALEAMEGAGLEALVEGTRHEKAAVRLSCLALLAKQKRRNAVPAVLAVLRKDGDEGVRVTAAAAFGKWDGPGVREALLQAAREDGSAAVQAAALLSLSQNSGPLEVEALFEMSQQPIEDATVRKNLFEALRHCTGQSLADEPALWKSWWWEAGGKEATEERAVQARREEGER